MEFTYLMTQHSINFLFYSKARSIRIISEKSFEFYAVLFDL